MRAFGVQMVRDAQLAQWVKSKGYKIPEQVNVVTTDKMPVTTPGARFDSNYVDMMAADHQKTATLFEN